MNERKGTLLLKVLSRWIDTPTWRSRWLSIVFFVLVCALAVVSGRVVCFMMLKFGNYYGLGLFEGCVVFEWEDAGYSRPGIIEFVDAQMWAWRWSPYAYTDSTLIHTARVARLAMPCWIPLMCIGLWIAPLFVPSNRRRIRIMRGLCPACAYPVGASDVCTECGRPVTARPGGATECSHG